MVVARSEYKKRWYLANKERMREYGRAWRERNSEQQKEYRRANKEKRAAQHTAWKEKNPERIKKLLRARDLRREYGITYEQYEALLVDQQGNCALCFEPLLEDKNLDHDHKTGKIRGILHGRCNRLLAFAQDSTTRLSAAVKYLRKHSSLTEGQ